MEVAYVLLSLLQFLFLPNIDGLEDGGLFMDVRRKLGEGVGCRDGSWVFDGGWSGVNDALV